MSRYDLPIDELRAFSPSIAQPSDFDAFWSDTISEARSAGAGDGSGNVVLERVASPLTTVEVYDLTFPGWGAQPVKAWFMVPAHTSGRLATVVEFNGYGGGRGLPQEKLAWVSAGYAYLFMDTRGQGSGWGTGGQTPDDEGSGPSHPGFMTRGIESPENYYYRRVFTDAVRAIDAVRTLDRVDPDRIAITGGSQGGGIALAVAGLVDGLSAVMPDVPFLCNFERAVGMTDSDPYGEIVRYLAVHRDLVQQSFATLSYFDGAIFATRASAPALFSVALLDTICPPSTVFATYNRFAAAEKAIEVYEFNNHEGGAARHWVRQAEWLAAHMGGAA